MPWLFVTNHHCWYCLSRICSVVKGDYIVTMWALYQLCFFLMNVIKQCSYFVLFFYELNQNYHCFCDMMIVV